MANQMARALRHGMTGAETTLWYLLRARRFAGWKFRREHPIGPFIVDFACVARRLIIEADGGQHAESADDVSRTNWLQARGWRVIRFWNDDILHRQETVLEEILKALESR
jgi:very-short-patch-repair endonuclease